MCKTDKGCKISKQGQDILWLTGGCNYSITSILSLYTLSVKSFGVYQSACATDVLNHLLFCECVFDSCYFLFYIIVNYHSPLCPSNINCGSNHSYSILSRQKHSCGTITYRHIHLLSVPDVWIFSYHIV